MTKQNIEKRMKIDKDRLRDLCDIIHISIHITGIPIRRRERKYLRKYLKK